jgi:hypothetical protein
MYPPFAYGSGWGTQFSGFIFSSADHVEQIKFAPKIPADTKKKSRSFAPLRMTVFM